MVSSPDAVPNGKSDHVEAATATTRKEWPKGEGAMDAERAPTRTTIESITILCRAMDNINNHRDNENYKWYRTLFGCES